MQTDERRSREIQDGDEERRGMRCGDGGREETRGTVGAKFNNSLVIACFEGQH
jgi:hypothetical protein